MEGTEIMQGRLQRTYQGSSRQREPDLFVAPCLRSCQSYMHMHVVSTWCKFIGAARMDRSFRSSRRRTTPFAVRLSVYRQLHMRVRSAPEIGGDVCRFRDASFAALGGLHVSL